MARLGVPASRKFTRRQPSAKERGRRLARVRENNRLADYPSWAPKYTERRA